MIHFVSLMEMQYFEFENVRGALFFLVMLKEYAEKFEHSELWCF